MEQLEWWSKYLLVVAIPYFLGGIGLELRVLRNNRNPAVKGFMLKDSAASLAMGLINLGMQALCAGVALGAMFGTYQHRLFDLDPSVWWTWPLLFIAEDFTYYWYHRAAHRIRFFWAEHVNHHSSKHYNLTTALRQSTTGPLYIFVFWLPLCLVGFHPLAVVVMHGVSLIYQFWIHTEAIGRLGILEWVFNTPSHHRAHHGKNPIYIDRNYGGWLIIWDRLFGTFQEELAAEPVVYGLVHDIDTYNPLRIAFHEWGHMLGEAVRAKSIGEAFGWLFRPPEWAPGR